MKWNGKQVLVTGAGGAIGEEVSLPLAAGGHGADVVYIDRTTAAGDGRDDRRLGAHEARVDAVALGLSPPLPRGRNTPNWRPASSHPEITGP